MATATQTLVATVKSELESHLPALLTAAGVDVPIVYLTGEPDLVPSTKTPAVAVDVPEYDQEGFIGSGGKRKSRVLVHFLIAGSDGEAVATAQHAYMDLIVKVLESEVSIGAAKLAVTDAQNTPNFSMRGSSSIYRGGAVSAELRLSRSRGDS